MILVDYKGLKAEVMIRQQREYERMLQSADEPVPVVIDFTDSTPDSMFIEEMKRIGVEYHSKVSRHAFVGITGLLKILVHGYIAKTRLPTEMCETLDAAKDFIASA